ERHTGTTRTERHTDPARATGAHDEGRAEAGTETRREAGAEASAAWSATASPPRLGVGGLGIRGAGVVGLT
ncbi:MAG: hypothetical protein KBF43_16920, partial [Dermatophilaceae bacterium]|nr:hypothetical protein [Dermatophilaceae bacterium]